MAKRKTALKKFWPLLRLGTMASAMILGLTVVGSGFYWTRMAIPQKESLQAQLQKISQASHESGIGKSTGAQVKAKLQTERSLLKQLQGRVPKQLTTLQVASFIYSVAKTSGVQVQAIGFGPTKPSGGYQATSVSINVLSPNPQTTVKFLQQLDGGALPISTSVTSFSLSTKARAVSIPATFYSEGGLT